MRGVDAGAFEAFTDVEIELFHGYLVGSSGRAEARAAKVRAQGCGAAGFSDRFATGLEEERAGSGKAAGGMKAWRNRSLLLSGAVARFFSTGPLRAGKHKNSRSYEFNS
ncbi:hypothetical protein Pssp01_13070 [Pseudomonas sp. NBRC 100443]|nr:hypothetical protein Pssp01_13070 [Pseudomonas sp. NBRC 100443]